MCNHSEQIERVKEVPIQSVPIIIVGNKSDLENERVISTKQGWCIWDKERKAERGGLPFHAFFLCAASDFAKSWGAVYYETSAKSGSGVDNAFLHLFRAANNNNNNSNNSANGQNCIIV